LHKVITVLLEHNHFDLNNYNEISLSEDRRILTVKFLGNNYHFEHTETKRSSDGEVELVTKKYAVSGSKTQILEITFYRDEDKRRL